MYLRKGGFSPSTTVSISLIYIFFVISMIDVHNVKVCFQNWAADLAFAFRFIIINESTSDVNDRLYQMALMGSLIHRSVQLYQICELCMTIHKSVPCLHNHLLYDLFTLPTFYIRYQ